MMPRDVALASVAVLPRTPVVRVDPRALAGAVIIGGSIYVVVTYSRTADFLRRPVYMSGPEFVPPVGSTDVKIPDTKGTPNGPDDDKHNKPNLTRIHSDETLKSGNRSSYDYWRSRSTDEIVRSLRSGAEEPLMVKPDGRIYQGNMRTLILEERGFDINSLPREIVP